MGLLMMMHFFSFVARGTQHSFHDTTGVSYSNVAY